MDPNAATTDQPTNPPGQATDASAAGENSGTPGLRARIQLGSDTAVAEHLAEGDQPRRGRGRPPIHGRYSTKGLPVAAVGDGTAATPGEEAETAVHPLGWQPEIPPFDEKSAAAMVDVGISALNYLGAFVVRAIGGREVPDKEIIDRAVANCQVSEDARRHLREGGLACARKYAVQMQYVAESQVALGLGMWALAVGSQVKELKDQGKQLRGQP